MLLILPTLDAGEAKPDIVHQGRFGPRILWESSMAEYNNRVRTAGTAIPAIDEGLRSYMLRVYNYMLMGLALTGAVAFAATNTALGNLFFTIDQATGTAGPNLLGWVAIFAPLAIVFFLSFRVHKMSFAAAQMTFWIYAAVMGISIALLLFQ